MYPCTKVVATHPIWAEQAPFNTSSVMKTSLSMDDVSQHASHDDLYVVIHDKVYDISSFLNKHPGGKDVLLDIGGNDATEEFEDVGHSDEAREMLEQMLIGQLKLPGIQENEKVPEPQISLTDDKGKETQSIGRWFNFLLACVVLLGSILVARLSGSDAFQGYFETHYHYRK